MRHLATALFLVALAAPAFAGANPDCQVCIDFSDDSTSWSDVQSRIDPAPYTAFSAYFCIYGTYAFNTVTLMGSVTPGMSTPPNFTNLLPGDLAIGTWDTGITMASTECINDRFIYMARLDLFYLGVPGDILFLYHPMWPGWVVDCTQPNGELDYYCVWMHGGVGKPALEGDEGCYPVVPVEDATWGAIKAMYR